MTSNGSAGRDVPAVVVEDLCTVFETRLGTVRAVDGVSFVLHRGERLAIVGESGSGKSVTALSMMRLIRPPGRIERGDIRINGRSVLKMREEELRKMRGAEVAMIFQDPMTSLNPVHTVGDQIAEAIRLHRNVSHAEARRRAAELLDAVQIPMAKARLDDYPHQFSGGMRQRVMIAMALANKPSVLIADEPTTALDVTTQAQILDLLDELCGAQGASVLLITHDLGVVSGFCDRAVVMYGGRVMESASTAPLFRFPLHPYTLGLLRSLPRSTDGDVELTPIPGEPVNPRALPPGCVFAERCEFRRTRCTDEVPPLRALMADHYAACHFAEEISEKRGAQERSSATVAERPQLAREAPVVEVRNLVKHFKLRRGGVVSAVEDVSFEIHKGETLGLVGESGSGKTTTALSLLRLIEPTAGRVLFIGEDVSRLSGARLRRLRREAQLIFQDPYSSLDPRMNIRDLVIEPLVIQKIGSQTERVDRAAELLELVGLSRHDLRRYPHQLSGGQRQRVGIARALALNPTFVVCDEPVSALDVSIQAQVLNLLRRLQWELGLTYLFVAHDLSVVRYVADRVAVMYLGKIVEIGTKQQIFEHACHPYTIALLSASPAVDADQTQARIVLTGEVPSAVNPPSGCRFRTRCPIVREICAQEEPPAQPVTSGQVVACHFAEESAVLMQAYVLETAA